MIFYVEDDASIRNLILYTLNMTGFQAKGFENGAQFWQALQENLPELILLDVMLPGESGIEILHELKSRPETMRLPVIMITAKDGEEDIVDGLETGADDYIAKPFSMMELIARIKAVLRRCDAPEKPETLRLGAIEIDTGRHTVCAGGQEVSLTLKEYELLRVMMESPERLIERDRLINSVWNSEYSGANHTLDAHIQTLRSKLGACGGQIQTIYGRGYKICAEANR